MEILSENPLETVPITIRRRIAPETQAAAVTMWAVTATSIATRENTVVTHRRRTAAVAEVVVEVEAVAAMAAAAAISTETANVPGTENASNTLLDL